MNSVSCKIIKAGFLGKKSKYLGNWKQRYIVLTETGIYAYDDIKKDSECTMDLLLSECSDLLCIEEEGSFCLSFKNSDHVYTLKANSNEERENWFSALSIYIAKP